MANIEKRNSGYLLTAYCGYTSDGKQIKKRKMWHPDPDKKYTEKQLQKAVAAAAAEFERSVLSPDYVDASRIKFSEFFEQYLELKKGILAPTTLAQYKRVVPMYILPVLGHVRLQDIRPIHVQQFIASLQSAKPALSSSSIHRYLAILKSIMAAAYKLGLIASNPSDSARLTVPPMEEKVTEMFTQEEAVYLLQCLKKEPIMWQCLIDLAIMTGARRGELVALKWSDISFKRNTVTIQRSNYKLAGEEIESKSTKTRASVRTVTVPDSSIALLRQWKSQQLLEFKQVGMPIPIEGWLFTQADGSPMCPTSPTWWFVKFQKRHNIPHHKFHALRHTSGTLLLASGADIKTVASRLGHTQLSTVNRYVHALEESDKSAAQALDCLHFSVAGKNDTAAVV